MMTTTEDAAKEAHVNAIVSAGPETFYRYVVTTMMDVQENIQKLQTNGCARGDGQDARLTKQDSRLSTIETRLTEQRSVNASTGMNIRLLGGKLLSLENIPYQKSGVALRVAMVCFVMVVLGYAVISVRGTKQEIAQTKDKIEQDVVKLEPLRQLLMKVQDHNRGNQ